MTTKKFPIHVVLSMTTGYLLRKPFGDMHEFAEWVVGHSIWTHEFADSKLAGRIAWSIFEQHPELTNAETIESSRVLDESYREAYIARAGAQFGYEIEFRQGTGERTESPISILQRMVGDKPITAVVAGDK